MKKQQNEATESTTALAVAPRENMTALQVVQNMPQIQKLGEVYAAAKFFGNVTASVATTAVINCMLEGLSPIQYKSKYHTFEDGTSSIRSDFYQRTFQKMGGSWEFVDWTNDVCEMAFYFNGKRVKFGKYDTIKVTFQEFKDNGVAMSKNGGMKDNWQKFPREMLKARCMATAIRAICPEAMEGMYTQEEVADFDRPAAPVAVAPTAAKVSPSPVAKDDAAQIHYGICPCGSVKGKSWGELPTETLEKVLATPTDKAPSLTPDHRNAIVAELARRDAAASDGDGEVVEAEVVEG